MSDLLADTKLAIELEEKGYDFYHQAAAKTTNPLAASTLSSLAERERDHMIKITQFYTNLTGEKTLDPNWLMTVNVPPSKEELLQPILKKLKVELNRKFETENDINEIYKVAEDLERDSFNLYEKIAKETTDETAKKFYTALAQEEREHYAILEDTLLYLNNPGDWFKKEERWIVEG